MGFSIVWLLFSVVSFGLCNATSFNVLDHGAIGDGKTDDSFAFLKAWRAACQASNSSKLIIPEKRTFLLYPASFDGPCLSSRLHVKVLGKIIAPDQKSAWDGHHINQWLAFSKVNRLVINGGGLIDGQGSVWWSQTCSFTGGGCKGPTALTFSRCNKLRLSGLTHVNSQRNHMTLNACKGAIISNLNIIAPKTSPNTDGIDIASSTNIQILNSNIETGDDCIAISGGSSNINIYGVYCGPGHGISIGALGKGNDIVENVTVRNCTMKGTLTGVRIKTWQGGSGHAKRIFFTGIHFITVYNPIIIDQFYCPGQPNCTTKPLAVKVSDVTYSKISGTSMMDNVINLRCSQSVACTNVAFDHVYIESMAPGAKPYATCTNAYGWATHTKPKVTCLKSLPSSPGSRTTAL